jgi:hypothetical protein
VDLPDAWQDEVTDMRKSRETEHEITRRGLLQTGSVLGLTALYNFVMHNLTVFGQRQMDRSGIPAKRNVTNPLSGEALYNDVIDYFNMGDHRAATEIDLRTSDWIARELRSAGFSVSFQPFRFRQFFVRRASLRIAGRNHHCFPLWYPRSAGSDLIQSKLVEFQKGAAGGSLRGRVALVRFPFDARTAVFKGSGHREIIEAVAKTGAAAVVAITEGSTGEVIALNSPEDATEWPVPVLIVGARDQQSLTEAAQSGANVEFLLDGRDDFRAEAKNVIGRLAGDKRLIVISTPQSGWFRCAGERGPGIAIFLALARWAGRRQERPSFLFVSTSAHELGGIGMKHFQEKLSPLPENVTAWLHLGAGIATYAWEDTAAGLRKLRQADSRRYLMCSADFESLLATTFAGQAGLTPVVGRAVGEMEIIMKRSYRAFGIAAGHRFHHTPADSPEMTDPALLEPVAQSIVRTLEAIEAKSSEPQR